MKSTKTINEVSIKERIKRINDLNLEPIIVKLIDEEEGEGWSIEQAFIAEKMYKRFLILTLKYPDQSIVPTTTIDTFWHYHILDTKMYAIDCEFAFGFFVHHFPYFGMRGEDDAKNLQEAFDSTSELYLTEFGDTLTESGTIFRAFQFDSLAKCDGSGSGPNQCGTCKNQCGKCNSSKIDFGIRPSLNIDQRKLQRQLALNENKELIDSVAKEN